MTVKAIQRNIPTWKRPKEYQDELNTLASASDFRVELDEVSHVDEISKLVIQLVVILIVVLYLKKIINTFNNGL